MKRQDIESGKLRKLRGGWSLTGLLAAGLVLGACGDNVPDPDPDGTQSITSGHTLVPVESCDSLDDYVADYATDMLVDSYVYGSYYGGVATRGGVGAEPPMMDDADATSTQEGGESNSGTTSGPSDYTTTNVQELGVDEPDLVKTNGTNLFVVDNSQGEALLHVLSSWPADEAHEIATVELEGWGDNLLLIDDTVIALTTIYQGDYYDDYGYGCSSPFGDCGRNAVDVSTPPSTGEEDSGFSEGSEGSSGSTGTDSGAPVEPDEDPDGEDGPDGEEDHGDEDSDVPDGDRRIPEGEYEEPPQYDEPFHGTRLTVIDVSDPSSPTITETYDIEGNMADARMVEGIIYVALNYDVLQVPYELIEDLQALDLPEPDWSVSEDARRRTANGFADDIHEVVIDYLADGGRDALIPDLRVGDDNDTRGDIFECSDFMRPARRSQLGVLAVVGFDPATGDDPAGMGLLATGWQVYGSTDNLYVAQDSRWWWWTQDDEPVTKTYIHQFGLNDGSPRYTASGEVDGWLLNSYAMSEYDGHLRVATSDQTWGWAGGGDVAVEGGVGTATTTDAPSAEPDSTEPVNIDDEETDGDGGTDTDSGDVIDTDSDEPPVVEPEPEPEPEPMPFPDPDNVDPDVDANNIFVLERNGLELELVGEVRGLAPTEQIFAIRFMGDRAYMVTFRQVDPLFTIDLSDPTSPQVLGELHITGFSNYLHPVGEDHLIGLGQEADMNGRVQGLHLQLFDVSDMTNPERIHHLVFDSSWSYSEAQHNPHAITYWDDQGLLALPVTIENWDGRDGYDFFSGLIIYDVSIEDGFTEVGRVSHAELALEAYCSETGEGYDYMCSGEESLAWAVQMRRSVFIDEYVFAISSLGVSSSLIENADELLATVNFYSPKE